MNPPTVPSARHGTQPSAPGSAFAADSCGLDNRGRRQLGPSSMELQGGVTTSLGPTQGKGEAIDSNRWFLFDAVAPGALSKIRPRTSFLTLLPLLHSFLPLLRHRHPSDFPPLLSLRFRRLHRDRFRVYVRPSAPFYDDPISSCQLRWSHLFLERWCGSWWLRAEHGVSEFRSRLRPNV